MLRYARSFLDKKILLQEERVDGTWRKTKCGQDELKTFQSTEELNEGERCSQEIL
jgi:hypothetical protein